jgi:amino acid transporter
MAPAATVAFALLISVPYAGPALPLSVLVALIACLCVASSIGQLAKEVPSAGGLYSYVSRALGPKPGFLTGWALLLFQPLVAPGIVLVFAATTQDVMQHDVGWSYGGQWWIWVLVAMAIVSALSYRDVRLSTNAGIVLGAFEIAVFTALALWMIVAHADQSTLQVFNPAHATGGALEGTFKGAVFAILAFIGFEAAAPLGEEARRPDRTVPRAVVLSALAIGAFYLLTSYAWVVGTGFDRFVAVTGDPANADPWRRLATIFWGSAWVLIFVAILNSSLASANAGVTGVSRVLYAMGRSGMLPRALARTHPVRQVPHVAILAENVFALAVALGAGWAWGPRNGFAILATAATIMVIVVYIAVCVATIVFYRRRPERRFLLHVVCPLLGIAALVGPLYYQYHPLPPYPLRIANWVALAWPVGGLVALFWTARRRPEALAPVS